MKSIFCFFASTVTCLLFSFEGLAIEGEIPIWPGAAPGSGSLSIQESVVDRDLDGSCTQNRAIIDIVTPAIIPFVPENPNGTAVIICPGGSYQRVVYDVEGVGIAEMFNELGVTAFILKYRLPINDHQDKQYVPLQDAQRAMRYVKNFAANWDIDTSKIGIMGCSAGGHAAASLATGFDKQVYTPIDSIDTISARPYFLLELYPVISMEPAITHKGTRDALIGSSPTQETIDEFSTEKHVTSLCPPAFIACARDDYSVNKENSIRFVNALHDAGVAARLNTYLNGGHGKGICKATGTDFARWVNDSKVWMDSLGLVSYQASDDASLKDIVVYNSTIENFHPDTLAYNIELPAGSTQAPYIGTKVNFINAVAVVNKPDTVPGTATIVVTAHDQITTRTYTLNFTVEESNVGFKEPEKNMSRIYPNPASDMLYIELNSDVQGASISVYTLNGTRLKNHSLNHGAYSAEVDISTLDRGLYLLEISDNTNRETVLFSRE